MSRYAASLPGGSAPAQAHRGWDRTRYAAWSSARGRLQCVRPLQAFARAVPRPRGGTLARAVRRHRREGRSPRASSHDLQRWRHRYAGHQTAQPLAAAEQPRHHRADWNAEGVADFRISELLEPDEQYDLALFRG